MKIIRQILTLLGILIAMAGAYLTFTGAGIQSVLMLLIGFCLCLAPEIAIVVTIGVVLLFQFL